MAAGEHINVTEDRAVMHMALRANRDEVLALLVAPVFPSIQCTLFVPFLSDLHRGWPKCGAGRVRSAGQN